MLQTLNVLNRLLLKHGHSGQAETVQSLINLHDSDQVAFFKLLHSGDMWGGSGAVWEVGPMGTDTKAFRDAIIQLSDEMDRDNIGMERTRFIAGVFRDWNQKGL